MKLLGSERHVSYTVIVGCGHLGANIADTLSDMGRNVLIMDKDKKAFRKLSLSFDGLKVEGDGMDLEALDEAGIKHAETVLAVTDDDNANIMIAQLAKEMFNVDRVVSRLYDPEKECVYRELGINTVCPAVLSENEVDRLLLKKDGESSKSEAKVQ